MQSLASCHLGDNRVKHRVFVVERWTTAARVIPLDNGGFCRLGEIGKGFGPLLCRQSDGLPSNRMTQASPSGLACDPCGLCVRLCLVRRVNSGRVR
jgi:hypothetical protein